MRNVRGTTKICVRFEGADGDIGGSWSRPSPRTNALHCIAERTRNASARGCSSSGLCSGDCAHPVHECVR